MKEALAVTTSTSVPAANPAVPSAPASGLSSMVLMLGTIAIFYFVLIRPQNKRMKEQQNMLARLQVGDEVATSGGVMGKITRLTEQYVVLLVAQDIEMKFMRGSVSHILPQGTLNMLHQN